jgi:hypothetical protein
MKPIQSPVASAHDDDLSSLPPEQRWPDVTPSGRRALAYLHSRTDEEILEIAVRAGISTPDGQLTANYRDDAEPSASRPTD